LSPSTIPHYSYVHDLQVKNKWLYPVYHYPILAFYSDIKHLMFRSKKKALSDKVLDDDAISKMKNWCFEFSIADFSRPLSLKNRDSIIDGIDTIRCMISFCRTHEYKPIVVIPPVHSSLSKLITIEIKDVLFSPVFEMLIQENVPIYDNLYNEKISNDRTLFQDSFLLNKKGSELFTKQILSELNLLK